MLHCPIQRAVLPFSVCVYCCCAHISDNMVLIKVPSPFDVVASSASIWYTGGLATLSHHPLSQDVHVQYMYMYNACDAYRSSCM